MMWEREDVMLRRMVVVVGMLGVLARGAAAEIHETATGEEAKSGATHGSYWSDAGYGTLATLGNILYMPAKVVYAGVGLLTGSLAYVLTAGDGDIAQSVWSPSLGGTYVITPEMLRGEQEIFFSGRSYSND